jgi:nitrite reductase/ring-hydroxylating ferredoxin subunit
MNKIIYKFKNLLLCSCIISINSCTKNQNIVPYVYVDQYINISLPLYSSLNSIGGWTYIDDVGSRGIIIYRQSYDQFSAYDRHCTFNADNPCGRATVDSTNSYVECACDSSRYQLFDGLVIQGPASYSLKNYQTSFDIVSNQIHIYN